MNTLSSLSVNYSWGKYQAHSSCIVGKSCTTGVTADHMFPCKVKVNTFPPGWNLLTGQHWKNNSRQQAARINKSPSHSLNPLRVSASSHRDNHQRIIPSNTYISNETIFCVTFSLWLLPVESVYALTTFYLNQCYCLLDYTISRHTRFNYVS